MKNLKTLVFLLKAGWNVESFDGHKPSLEDRFIMIMPLLVVILSIVVAINPGSFFGFNWYAPIEYAIFMFAANMCSLALTEKNKKKENVILVKEIHKVHWFFAKVFWIFLVIMIINLLIWLIFSLILKIY